MRCNVPAPRNRRWRLLALVALIAALVAAGCGGDDGGDAATTGAGTSATGGGDQTLTFAMSTDPSSLDPHVHGDRGAYSVDRQVFDTLVVRDDESKEFVAGLAESWRASPDGRSYTFKLRPDVRFQDGTPFDAAAVVFNVERIMNPATKSATARDIIGPVAKAVAKGDDTVVVTYRTTTSPTAILDAFSQAYLGMVSPAAVKRYGKDFGRNPVGTGPFTFREWAANDHITLVRNEDYEWAPANADENGPAQLAGITFRIMPEAATRVAALESGDIGMTQKLEPTQAQRLEDSGNVRVVRGIAPGFPISMWMNTEAGPLTDQKVRQAMLSAFDRRTMLENVYQGQYEAAYGPLSPATWSYNPAVEEMYPFDVDRANQLLDEAGWRRGADGIREKDGQKLRVRLFDLEDPRRGEYLQANMKEVGIDLVPRIVSSPDLFALTRKADGYEMASTWFASSDPSVLNVLFLSSNVEEGFAISRWRDPALDKQLAAGVETVDDAEREKVYQQMQVDIMDKALLIPMYAETALDGIQNVYQGYRLERGQYPLLYGVRVG